MDSEHPMRDEPVADLADEEGGDPVLLGAPGVPRVRRRHHRGSSPRLPVAGRTGAVLLVQLAVVRPRLSRRSDRVLAGEDAPRSRAHYAYVGLELVKVAALLATGIFLLAR